jgi:hypothetical protein
MEGGGVSEDGYARERIRVAKELMSELTRSCPDAQHDEIGARDNCAARAALRSAVESLQHLTGEKWFKIGKREGALMLISAVEMSMYDPRLHPGRYGLRVDTESSEE